MRIVNIADVLQLGHDEIVPSVRGRVTEIYDHKSSPPGSDPAWAFQNLKIKDSTGTIKVVCKSREPLPKTLRNKIVFIFSKQGDKGLTGIKVKDEEYPKGSGKITKVLSVTPTATIEESDVPPQPSNPEQDRSDNDGPPPDDYDRQAQSAKTESPIAPDPRPTMAPETNHGKIGDCKRALNSMANLYLYCLEAGLYIRDTWDQNHPERIMKDEQFQGAVSSLFIQATREGRHTQIPSGAWTK